MNQSWQKRRAGLNHDWLKNKLLQEMGKWINILNEQVEDEQFERDFARSLTHQWAEHRREAADLANTFQTEMSPRRFLDHYPFPNLPTEEQCWLGELIHELWLSRYPVQDWTSTVVACTRDADEAFLRITDLFRQNPNATARELKRNLDAFEQIKARCEALAKAIEAFPSKVLVV